MEKPPHRIKNDALVLSHRVPIHYHGVTAAWKALRFYFFTDGVKQKPRCIRGSCCWRTAYCQSPFCCSKYYWSTFFDAASGNSLLPDTSTLVRLSQKLIDDCKSFGSSIYIWLYSRTIDIFSAASVSSKKKKNMSQFISTLLLHL